MSNLYHVSNTPNLKVLQPNKCKHGVSYLYVAKDYKFALIFGAKGHGMFDGPVGVKKGIPYFQEAYPNSFGDRYDKKECYIYEVAPDNFSVQTENENELVSTLPAKIVKCTKVNDIGEYLRQLAKKGEFDITYYDASNKKYVANMRKYIKKTLILRNILNDKNSRHYDFCLAKFADIIKEI